jgi:tetratricopeptide (TPR) repeat protein
MRLREGADAEEAERLLAQAPASLDTFTKLVRAKRLDDALVVLKRALEAADAAQTIAALRALNNTITSFQFDQTRSYHDTIRNLVEPVRARVATLPREEAARLAWELLYVDRMFDRRGGQVSQFIHDYSGTETALLAQVDLLMSNPGQILKEISELDQFARDHPGTNAGAKALFEEGFQLCVNIPVTGIEPRGSDPTDRLLRVAAIVNELESGSFPPSEWVDKAPSLMVEFFVSDTPPPAYSPENLDRAIDIYTEFVRTHLRLSGALDLDNSIGYVIVSKLGDLFARKGDRVGGIERTLDDLEKAAPDPGAVQLLRAQYYARQSTAGPAADRATMAAKAQTALAKLASANLGASSRRALAFEAAFHYYRRDYTSALPEYQEYLNRHSLSSWAPIAALRIGECYEQAKDWGKAADAYARAAARYSSEPYARVLGGAFASRALEAQGRFEDALAAATQALNGWDTHYGIEYTILSYQTEAPSVTSGAVVNRLSVTRDDLTARVPTLDGDLRQRGGQLLARGRWELDQRQFSEAVSLLTTFLQQEPRSPVLADARSLLHRAQLELALDLANAESPHYDKAKAAATLDAIAKEPFDAVVATAALAKALLMATEGRDGDAEALMARTLDSWVASQHDLAAQPPAEGIDADIAEIRQVVFRPFAGLRRPLQVSHGTPSFYSRQPGASAEDIGWPGSPPHGVSDIPRSRSRVVSDQRRSAARGATPANY